MSEKKQSGKRFIYNALLMTAVSFLLRFAGTLFNIFLVNQIGSEGIGLFQLAASIYFLGVTLATSGITVAVTRVVAEQSALKNQSGVSGAVKRCMFMSFVLSIVAGILLFTLSEWLGSNILNDIRVINSLKVFSLGLPFLAVAAVIRGYFIGINEPGKAAAGDLAEQASAIAVTIPLLSVMSPMGLENACLGLVIGSVASEVFSCIFAIILYVLRRKKDINHINEPQRNNGLTKRILSIACPIAASGYLRSALVSMENLLIPAGLMRYGLDNSEALSQYGMVKGMVMPLLFFPTAVLGAFAGLLVPEVSRAAALGARTRIIYITNKCIQVTLLFSFFVFGMFLCFSNELGDLFYKSKEIGRFLLILSPLIPLLYLDQIVDSILKGLNQQVAAMQYNTVDSLLRILLLYLLLPCFGINGYIIMFYAGTIFNAGMSIRRLLVVGGIKFYWVRWVLLPMLAAALACIASGVLLNCPLWVQLTGAGVLYTFILYLLGCVRKNDIMWVAKLFKVKKVTQ